MYDSLKYVKILEEVGFPRPQAEAQVTIMADILTFNLATKNDLMNFATKQDLADLSLALKQDMKELESSLRGDMKELESSLRKEIKTCAKKEDLAHLATKRELEALASEIHRIEHNLTIKLGGIIVGLFPISGILNSL